MSSRSSKSSKSSKSNRSSSSSIVKNDLITTTTVTTVLYNLLILGYIYNLEGRLCNCFKDWRHNFIKYFCISLILWSIICYGFTITMKNEFANVIQHILIFLGLINIWCLYTYVGDLDKTKCFCAVEKQKDMHYVLYIWRYFLVAFIILILLGIISYNLNEL